MWPYIKIEQLGTCVLFIDVITAFNSIILQLNEREAILINVIKMKKTITINSVKHL